MDCVAFKYLSIGLMSIAFACSALGIGKIVSSYFDGSFRNPEAISKNFTPLLLGLAFAEAVALFVLVISILVLFN